MRISRERFDQEGTFVYNLVLPGINPPIPPFPPFENLPDQIQNVLRHNSAEALSTTDIMLEIEGDIISPISGFIFTTTLDFLLGEHRILAKNIDGTVYFVMNV